MLKAYAPSASEADLDRLADAFDDLRKVRFCSLSTSVVVRRVAHISLSDLQKKINTRYILQAAEDGALSYPYSTRELVYSTRYFSSMSSLLISRFKSELSQVPSYFLDGE